MALVLAIEPDPQQATRLEDLMRTRVGATLVRAETTERALAAIGHRVPDLVLVPSLLSAQEDAAIAGALRVIAAAADVRMLTIPMLADPAEPAKPRGVFARWRKSSAPAVSNGCDPAVFAAQITTYLSEAAHADHGEDEDAEETDGVQVASPPSRPPSMPAVPSAPSSEIPPPPSREIEPSRERRNVVARRPVADAVTQTAVPEIASPPALEPAARSVEVSVIRPEPLSTIAIPEPASAVVIPEPLSEPVVLPAMEAPAMEPPAVEPPPIFAAADAFALRATVDTPVASTFALRATADEPIAADIAAQDVAPDIEAAPIPEMVSAIEVASIAEVASPIQAVAATELPPAMEVDQVAEFAAVVDMFAMPEQPSASAFALHATEDKSASARARSSGELRRDLAEAAVGREGGPSDDAVAVDALIAPLLRDLTASRPPAFALHATADQPVAASAPAAPIAPIAPAAPVAPAAPALHATADEPAASASALRTTADKPVAPSARSAPIAPAAPAAPVAPAAAAAASAPIAPVAPAAPAFALHATADKPVASASALRATADKPVAPSAPAALSAPIAPIAPAAPVADADPMFFAEHAAPATERPAWVELIDSLRQDLERMRLEREGSADAPPAPVVVASFDQARSRARSRVNSQPLRMPEPARVATPPAKNKKRKPIQDQWGLFDPEQCGFAALLAKLDEIGAREEASA